MATRLQPMTFLTLVLLGAGVLGAAVPPWSLPAWVAPVAATLVALALGAVGPTEALTTLGPLVEPLAFLVLAVPLAVLLDQTGAFDAAAALADRGGRLALGLWALAAVSVAVLNLDAAVVLLTPLYVGIARRHRLDPMVLAVQPVLLALFASGVLPASNLTTLVAAARVGLDAADVLRELAPSSVAAVAVGWWAYRRWSGARRQEPLVAEAVDAGALRTGGCVLAVLLVGFTVGDHLGVPAWAVAAFVVVGLALRSRGLPWRAVPLDSVALVAGLAVLAAAASAQLPVATLIGGQGPLAELRAMAVAAVGANLVNNLPALLVALPALAGADQGQLWAVLVGVNIGPVVLAGGSLSTLLWLRTVRSLGLEVSAARFTAVGLRIGLPAFGAAVAVRLVVSVL